jgi:hypothetical protein
MDHDQKYQETLETLGITAECDPLELTEGLLPALAQQCVCADLAKAQGEPIQVPGCKHPLWIRKTEDNLWTILPEAGSSTLFRAVLHTCGQGQALSGQEWTARITKMAETIHSQTSLQTLANIILAYTTQKTQQNAA